MARIPPAIFGCMVFTRPSSISGKPVISETSITGMPASRIRRAVPPVEIRFAPNPRRSRANSTTPLLSVTLIRTRSILFMAGVTMQSIGWNQPDHADIYGEGPVFAGSGPYRGGRDFNQLFLLLRQTGFNEEQARRS